MKQVMYEQRMKEIEDDILPFGFVDDGTDYVQEQERQAHPWAIEYAEQL